MRIIAVPCLKDNYAYLVCDDGRGIAAIVDPGEAAPVLAAAAANSVRIATVWATHHHPDHVGGIAGLLAALGPLEIVAHNSDRQRITHATRFVDDGDVVQLGDVAATIIFNPGHTLGAISYWLRDHDAVFTGDTLFGAGCGRMFEGNPPMMHASLMRLAALPPTTRVYFGHEYTASNLRFATLVSPHDAGVAARVAAVTAQVAAGHATTPSLMADEVASNPFLRCADPAIVAAANERVPGTVAGAAAFGVLREWKNVA
ncbi:MAG TPA: hydroxyacylglutathione hydrolase [Kofleriaceae bacterium]|nr:hydroxyacylglutathione hydrolase [Kofleriaceae bacterium]